MLSKNAYEFDPKRSLYRLRHITMSNREENYCCEGNSHKDVSIRHEKIDAIQWSWVLESTWHAIESKVKDDLASEEEIVIHSDTLLISYCPFCGENLTLIQKHMVIESSVLAEHTKAENRQSLSCSIRSHLNRILAIS